MKGVRVEGGFADGCGVGCFVFGEEEAHADEGRPRGVGWLGKG